MFASQRAPTLILMSLMTVTALSVIVACGSRDQGDTPISSTAGKIPGKVDGPGSQGEPGQACVAPFKLKAEEETLQKVDADHPLAEGHYKATSIQMQVIDQTNVSQSIVISKNLAEEGAAVVTDCNTIAKDAMKATIQTFNVAFSPELDGATQVLTGTEQQLAFELKDGELNLVTAATAPVNMLTGQLPVEKKKIDATQEVTAILYKGAEEGQVELHAQLKDSHWMPNAARYRYVRIVFALQDKPAETPAAVEGQEAPAPEAAPAPETAPAPAAEE